MTVRSIDSWPPRPPASDDPGRDIQEGGVARGQGPRPVRLRECGGRWRVEVYRRGGLFRLLAWRAVEIGWGRQTGTETRNEDLARDTYRDAIADEQRRYRARTRGWRTVMQTPKDEC